MSDYRLESASNPSDSCPKRSDIRTVMLHKQESQGEVAADRQDNQETLIGLWLHGRPATTVEAYRADLDRLICFVGKPLSLVTLGELQAFVDQLHAEGLAQATVRRAISSVKSLYAFGTQLGYFQFDNARPLRVPRIKNTLSEKLLESTDVRRMIALEPDDRNRAMLALLYSAGLRVSELCSLRWRDYHPRKTGGQITVQGKGDRTRAVLIGQVVCLMLLALRCNEDPDTPMFLSRKQGQLGRSQVWRIVKAAARRAGLQEEVSTHWLRHAHASHAIDGGAPLHVVQQTLGHSSVATTGVYLHARPTESSSQYIEL